MRSSEAYVIIKILAKTSNRPGLDILGMLSYQMLPASILANLYFQVTR